MKLIIAGASGFVGTELVRQSLRNPKFTSVVALARRSLEAPTDLGPAGDLKKLRSVQVKDYDEYTDDVKQQLANADACIWTVAITPTKLRGFKPEEVRHVCYDFTITGIKTIFEASKPRGDSQPFRFMYMSGIAAERDQTKTPDFMPAYTLLRMPSSSVPALMIQQGEIETAILDIAAQHPGQLEACAAKPGLITQRGDILKTAFAWLLKTIKGLPNIDVADISTAMLDQVINGFDKEPLLNDDLFAIAKRIKT